MTTPSFNRRAGPVAQAMNRAFELSKQGQTQGTFTCPKCGSQVRYSAQIAHKSSGACTAACGVRWAP